MKSGKIVIFRTSGSVLDYKTYNCQEVGLARALSLNGYDVSVIMAGNVRSEHKIQIQGFIDVKIYYLRYKAINQSLCLFEDWKKLLEKLMPDIIQIHDLGMFMNYLVIKWAEKHNIKTVLIQGNYQTTLKPFLKQAEKLFNCTFGRYTLNHVKGVGCKTIMAAKYVKHYNNRCFTMLTPIGLDTSRFAQNSTEINEKRKCKSLLYVGCLEKRRNPDFLVRLLKTLPKEYELNIVGDGSMKDQIAHLIDSLNLKDRCHLLGKINQADLQPLYINSDLFLLASNYEIFGMVILESMFFGLPVISTLTAGSETIIDNGKDGIIINDLNVEKWAKEIVSVLNDDACIDAMRKSAKYKIDNNFVWDKAVDNFIALYNH